MKKFKLNIIDIAIILVVVAAVAFFGFKFMTTGGASAPADKVEIVFFEEECPDFVPPHTQVGDKVLDGTENNYMGRVTDVVVDKSITYNVDERTQEVTIGTKEGYCSVYITAQCEGTLSENGVVINGTLYGVGHTLILHAGTGKYYLTIYDITPIK